jgi:hypothetical protein
MPRFAVGSTNDSEVGEQQGSPETGHTLRRTALLGEPQVLDSRLLHVRKRAFLK